MGRDRSRSPKRSHRNRSRDRSRERRRRSPRRSPPRKEIKKEIEDSPDRRRDRRRESPKAYRREVKQEVVSDGDRSPRSDDDRRQRQRRRQSPENRPRRDDGKQYGLERKAAKPEENWGRRSSPKTESDEPIEKEKVNLGTSGKLAEDTNTFRGVVIKYNEPPEAKKPNARWRLYPFKGDEALPVLYIHRQSAYLIGRDHKIADIPVDHPSCSKQHAVLQYRSIPFTRDDGTKARRIIPYIIDLASGNGTFLNNEKIDPQRYYELHEKDMIKFGFSTREYIIMKEKEIIDSD
ncbi:unnamed protein product [Caenorhabditis bovis]|uniref:FHA domain-containing protein n=1 Tax=Caenorhabditis bovis TaxID=2654633 RepID=A0A8S1F1H1_9PELO|nr:unnamed protein product [Caenorhabditis bovis]